MAPEAGFEPATNRLTVDDSTTELFRNKWMGWRVTIPRMSAPKTDALPLGYTPSNVKFRLRTRIYIVVKENFNSSDVQCHYGHLTLFNLYPDSF